MSFRRFIAAQFVSKDQCQARRGFSLPEKNKTGLAKAATICAITLGISLGLCGLNFVGFAGASSRRIDWLVPVLGITGYIEIAGIVFSTLGLLFVGTLAIAKVIFAILFRRGEQQ